MHPSLNLVANRLDTLHLQLHALGHPVSLLSSIAALFPGNIVSRLVFPIDVIEPSIVEPTTILSNYNQSTPNSTLLYSILSILFNHNRCCLIYNFPNVFRGVGCGDMGTRNLAT